MFHCFRIPFHKIMLLLRKRYFKVSNNHLNYVLLKTTYANIQNQQYVLSVCTKNYALLTLITNRCKFSICN